MKKYLFIFMVSMKLFAGAELEPLVIGTSSGYAPYVSLNAQGEYEGFDIDFAQALAKKLNRKLVIKDGGSMPSLLLALQQEKVDLLIWGISMTEDRMQKMKMIYYQGEKVTQMPFLFWKKVPEGIGSIEDLGKNAKYSVSVEAGSFQESVLKKYPQVRLKQVEKITDAIMEIRFGKSIAAMTDQALVEKLTTQYPDIKVLYLPLKPGEYSLGSGMCMNKTDQQLADEVKTATEQLMSEGTVAELEKKWNLRG